MQCLAINNVQRFEKLPKQRRYGKVAKEGGFDISLGIWHYYLRGWAARCSFGPVGLRALMLFWPRGPRCAKYQLSPDHSHSCDNFHLRNPRTTTLENQPLQAFTLELVWKHNSLNHHNFWMNYFLIRGALLYQIRSFFEHCSKGGGIKTTLKNFGANFVWF